MLYTRDLYNELTRRKFKKHKGFVDYNSVASRFCEYIDCMISHAKNTTIDEQLPYLHAAWSVSCNPIFPVYAVTPDLLSLLRETDYPTSGFVLNQSFESALIVFPRNSFTDSDGDTYDWFYVNHFCPFIESEYFCDDFCRFISKIYQVRGVLPAGNDYDEQRLQWVSFSDNGVRAYSCFAINSDSQLCFGEVGDGYLKYISTLILQVLMYMQIPRNENQCKIESEYQCDNTKLSRAKYSQHLNIRDYVWLDASQREKSCTHQAIGSHSSPVMHWRRGHWRKILTGTEKKNERFVWIPPTVVNGYSFDKVKVATYGQSS